MRTQPEQIIDPKALDYWRVTGSIGSLFYWLFPLGSFFSHRFWGWPLWIAIILTVAALGLSFFSIITAPTIRWKTWRYEVTEQDIELLYGVIVKHRLIIPMVRVQHVDTEQGPIMRRYGLSSVTIATAAGDHEIPALADEVADQLRDRISELARVVDEDV